MNLVLGLDRDDAFNLFKLKEEDNARLKQITLQLLQLNSLREVAEVVLSAVMEFANAEVGVVYFPNREGGSIEVTAGSSATDTLLSFVRSVLSEADDGKNPKPGSRFIHIKDVDIDPSFAPLKSVAREAGFRSLLSFPLRDSYGGVLGVGTVCFRKPNRPFTYQSKVLQAFLLQAERIVERKLMEEKLNRKDHQLQLLANSAPVVLAHLGDDLRYKFVNKAYSDRFGKTPGFFIGKTIIEAHNESVLDNVRCEISRVLRGESFTSETKVHYPQIGMRIVRVGWAPEFDGTGRVVGWVSAVTDVTDHVRIEAELRESDHRLKTVLQAGRMGWWELDLTTGDLSCSPTCKANFGRSPDAPFTYQDLKQSIHPDDSEYWQGVVHGAIAQGSEFTVEYRNIWPDGSVHWVSVRGNCTVDNAQRTLALAGVSLDITDRKRAEEALRSSEERFRVTFDNAAVGMAIVARDGRWLRVNETLCRMTGYSSEELMAMTFGDITHPDDLEQDWIGARELLEGKATTYSIDKRYLKKGGGIVWVNLTVSLANLNSTGDSFVSVMKDISLRKATEEKLRESEDRNRTLVESLPLLVWTCNASGECDFLSPQWLRYTGLPAGGQLGSGWVKQIHPDDIGRLLAVWNNSVQTGANYRTEYRIRRADGLYRWFAALAVPMRNAKGEIIKWFGTNTDIDERLRSEAALRESRERLEAALSASSTGTFRWNIQTNELDWDDQLDRLFGLTPGKTARSLAQFIDLVHLEDRSLVISACERCSGTGADFHEEFRVIWPDGSIHWLDDKGKTFLDSQGRPDYMTGACIDITGRKNVEEELRSSREILRLAQEIAEIGTFEWNIQTNSNRWSPELERIYGLEPGSFRGTYEHWSDMVHPDDRRIAEEHVRVAFQSGAFSSEWRIVRQNGDTRWIEARAYVFKDDKGEPLRMVGVNFDVTRRKQVEHALLQAQQALAKHAESLELVVAERTASLKRAVEQMEEFSYSVSHDLRAPIRAINQYAKLLSEEFHQVLGEHGLHFVNRIIRSSERMNQLTLDTLALSKIARGPVDLSPISLDTLVGDIISENPSLQAPRAEIEIITPLGMVAGNASLLTQAVSNLLINAVKFVPAGRIPKISLWTEAVGNMARLYIKDNGIGIAPEYQHRLFGIFQRVHPDSSYEGTGIGLAIVRKAVERLDGQVGMSSDGVNGSLFWIQLRHPCL